MDSTADEPPHPTLRPLKLNVVSDLHLSQGGMERPRTDADIVVVAGDVALPERAMDWMRGFDRPVLYVPGNHEFYGSGLAPTIARLRELAAGSTIHVLERDELVLDGVRFLGTTLWSDFLLDGDGEPRRVAMQQAAKFTRDFSRIESPERPGAPFSPEDCAHVFARDAGWLEGRIAEPFSGSTVVITHHAPSRQSIHPRFAGSPLNNAFVSDLERLMGRERVALWIHGHTHDSFDYDVAGTRVVCNPRGYSKGGVNENAAFDPGFIARVERAAKPTAAGA